MTDAEFDHQVKTLEAKDAFEAYVAFHGGINGDMAMNAWANAFAVEVYGEYADDLQRWTVALNTARDYVDAGVTGY